MLTGLYAQNTHAFGAHGQFFEADMHPYLSGP